MKNRSTIQTLTFVQTNPDHLYMKLNMKLVVVHGDFSGSYFLGARAAPAFIYRSQLYALFINGKKKLPFIDSDL